MKSQQTLSQGLVLTPLQLAVMKEQEYERGGEKVYALFQEFVTPGLHLVRTMTNIINYINGIMANDHERGMTQDLLDKPRADLVLVIDKIDELNKKAAERYGVGYILIDTHVAIQFRDAIVAFRTQEKRNGDTLRALADKYSEVMKDQNQMRGDFIAGPTEETKIMRQLYGEAKGSHYQRGMTMIRYLTAMRGNEGWTPFHASLLTTLLQWNADEVLGKRLKTYKNRWRS